VTLVLSPRTRVRGIAQEQKVMNNQSVFRALAIAVLVLAGAAAIGIGAYNAGMAQGIAESARAVAAAPPGAPAMYVWPRPWGFGFFPIFPFFFFVFLFFALRGLLWRGPWRGGCGYHHREQPASTPPAGGTTS
jgi:hypothetical protein